MKEFIKYLWRLLFPLRTTWIPFTSHMKDGYCYLILIKKYITSGKYKFKTIKVTNVLATTNLLPKEWIESEHIWKWLVKYTHSEKIKVDNELSTVAKAAIYEYERNLKNLIERNEREGTA